MALIDSEGFGLSTATADYDAYSVFSQTASSGSVVKTAGPFGDNYLALGSYRHFVGAPIRRLPAATTALFLGYRLNLSLGPSGTVTGVHQVAFGDITPAEQVTVVFTASTGLIQAFRGTEGGTLLGSSALGAILAAAWTYVEIGVVISSTAGSVTVRVSGTTVLSVTGVNTQATANTTVAALCFGGNASVSGGSIAHIYVCDTTGIAPWNTYLGDVRVQTLLPTANDAVQFTPNGLAANWSNAALTVPVPGTDYNASSTAGQQDTFAMAAVASGIGVVYGVAVKPLLLKSDAGARSGATALKSGATTTIGTSTPLPTTAAQLKTVYQIDPNTAAQWTVAGANAIKAGYKVTA